MVNYHIAILGAVHGENCKQTAIGAPRHAEGAGTDFDQGGPENCSSTSHLKSSLKVGHRSIQITNL